MIRIDPGLTVTLRWMVLNVPVDTTRHAGHIDILRESLDGRTGLNQVLTNTVDTDDHEYWRMFRARMSGEIDREAWMAYNRSRPDYDPTGWDAYMQRAWGGKTPRQV